jgi:hypothetical protein
MTPAGYKAAKKGSRGGVRPGAGRKPRQTPRKAITVRLEPQDAAKLKTICQTTGQSQAGWITGKIQAEVLKLPTATG